MKKQLILFVVLAMICAFTTVTVHEAHADWRKTIKEKYDSYKRNKQLKKDQNTIGGTGRKETEAEKQSQSSGSQAPKQDNTKATGHTYRTVQIGPWNTYKSGEIHNHLTITNFHFDDGWKYYNREWDRLTFYKNGSKWTLEVSLIRMILFAKKFTWKNGARVKSATVVLKNGKQHHVAAYLTGDYRGRGNYKGKAWSIHLNDIKILVF